MYKPPKKYHEYNIAFSPMAYTIDFEHLLECSLLFLVVQILERSRALP